jgi:hypothetical protein
MSKGDHIYTASDYQHCPLSKMVTITKTKEEEKRKTITALFLVKTELKSKLQLHDN